MVEKDTFTLLLGVAAIKVWGDMPRDIQELLFETAMQDHTDLRHSLAVLLHEHHPRTAHPPRPV